MRVKTFTNLLLTTLLVTAVSACGGGGGGGGTKPVKQDPTPPPAASNSLSVEIDEVSVSVSEGETVTVAFDVDYNGTDTLSYSLDLGEGESVNVSTTETSLQITADIIEGINASVDIALTVSDGTLSDTDNVTVNIVNTSFWVTRDALLDNAKGIKAYAQSDVSNFNLATFLTDVDYKLERLDADNFDDVLSQRIATITESNASLLSNLTALVDTLQGFDAPDATGDESLLQSISEDMQLFTKSYADEMRGLYAGVSSVDGEVLPLLNITSLFNVDGEYSLFFGNPIMGKDEQGQWSYANEYRFLSTVLEANVCYAL